MDNQKMNRFEKVIAAAVLLMAAVGYYAGFVYLNHLQERDRLIDTMLIEWTQHKKDCPNGQLQRSPTTPEERL